MGSSNLVEIDRPAADVFAVVCDPTTFPDWLVGAQRVVEVDDRWPAVGSRFEHRIGWGPFCLAGSTTVKQVAPSELLSLAAGMGPLGEAVVTIRLEDLGGTTAVSIEETPSRGIAGAAERAVRPVVALALWGRNQASLAMLTELVRKRFPSPA